MIKGDYIEYEFDLFSIKNEDVIENFKKRFGSIITKKGLHYEIYEIGNDKMSGGSASTFPYNKFEETLDTLLGKKNELSNNSKTLYDSLFSNFTGPLENDVVAKKKLENNEIPSESEDKPEEKTEEKPEEKTEEDAEDKPEEKTEENVEEKPEEKTEENVEEKPEEKTEEKTEENVEEKPEEKTEEDAEDKPEEKTEEDAEEDPEDKPEEETTKTIIRVKLIVQHMKKLIDLEDIKKGKNL